MALSQQEQVLAKQASFGNDITSQREAAAAISDLREYNDDNVNEGEAFSTQGIKEKSVAPAPLNNKQVTKEQKPVVPELEVKEDKPFRFSERELFTKLGKADAAGDTLAATAIANEIRRMRATDQSRQEGELAVSTDVIDPDTRTVRSATGDIMAGVTAGWQETFIQNWGTYYQSFQDANSWTNVRFMGTNPKTGNRELAQSTAQWIGMSDSEWNAASQDTRREAINSKVDNYLKEEYNPDTTSAAFNIAKFGGMIIDPTTALPLTGGPLAMMAKGAAVGGTDAVGWSLVQEGEVTGTNLAIGVGAGMIPGVGKGLYRGSKVIGKGVSRQLTPKVRREATDKLAGFDSALQKNLKKYDNYTTAYLATRESAGMSDDSINALIKQSQTGKAFQGTRDNLNAVLEPISDRIRKISPVMHKNLIDMERKILDTSHKAMTASDTFLNSMKALERKDALSFHVLKKAMLNSDGDKINKIIREAMPDSANDYETYRGAMKDMWKLVSESREGVIGKEVEHYTHRAVKDYKAIRNWLLSKGGKEEVARIDKLLKSQFKGRNATDEELNAFYSRFLDGVYDAKKVKQKPGAAKGRTMKVIPDELVSAFHNPDLATHTYVRSMTEDAYKKSLFGKSIVKANGDNLTDSIAAYIQKEHTAGRISSDDIEEVKTLLELRFNDGLKKPNEHIQKFKDFGYAMLLGNPISAATQLGDVFLATWKVGFRNSMVGLSKAISGKGLSPKEFGLMDSMLEEMVSTGKSKKYLRIALKYGGFQKVDQLGKATLMNGSLRKYQKLADKNPEKLRKMWGEAYGKDFDKLVKELKESAVKGAEPSGDVKSLVFADLADVQPITLLEMPEKYLANPNGRVFYMLRTFQLKYMNLLRKTMVEGFEKGNRVKAVTSGFGLMSMFTAGGITSDLIKHAMLSRDPNIDDIVVDNILANTGLFNSRYDAGKLLGKKPLTSVAGQLVPPVGVFDPFAYAFMQKAMGEEITKEDKARMMGKIPIVGRLIENYGFGGKDRFAEKEFNKSMKIDDLDIDL